MSRRIVCMLLTLCAVTSALAQDAAIGPDGARHLLGRTGFAASPADIRAFAPLARHEAADRLLCYLQLCCLQLCCLLLCCLLLCCLLLYGRERLRKTQKAC